jgi:hypothetical protein
MFRTLPFRPIGFLLLVGLLANAILPSGQATPAAAHPTAASLTFAAFRATVRRLWDADTSSLPALQQDVWQQQPTLLVTPVPGLDAYIAELRGQSVQDWTGWVLAVRPAAPGQYAVTVDMDEYDDVPLVPRLYSDAGAAPDGVDVLLTGLPAEQGAALRPDMRLTISGQIADVRQPLQLGFPNPKGITEDQVEGNSDNANAGLMLVLTGPVISAHASALPDLQTLTDLRGVAMAVESPVCGMGVGGCYTSHMAVYGDGRVIYRESGYDLDPAGAPPFERHYTVPPEKIRALFALYAQAHFLTVQPGPPQSVPSDTFFSFISLTAGGARRQLVNWDFDTTTAA